MSNLRESWYADFDQRAARQVAYVNSSLDGFIGFATELVMVAEKYEAPRTAGLWQLLREGAQIVKREQQHVTG